MHKNFQYRLARLLSGRKPYPWAQSIGISRGTVDRMLNGKIPRHEVLGRIMHAENVSITWLTEGVGAPFLVSWYPTDQECRLALEELLAFQSFTVHRLSDGGRVEVLVLHAEVNKEYEHAEPLSYTDINVLAGCGPATVALAARRAHRVTYAGTETVADVAAGRKAGTWYLLGDDGLLGTYQTITQAMPRVADDQGDYQAEGADAVSGEERGLLEISRELDPDARARWREVGSAFVAARKAKRDTGNDDER